MISTDGINFSVPAQPELIHRRIQEALTSFPGSKTGIQIIN
jgi:hypothetical protein